MLTPPGLVVENSAVLVAWKTRVPGPKIVVNFCETRPEERLDSRVSIILRMSIW